MTIETTRLVGGPAHGQRVAVGPHLGGRLRWVVPPKITAGAWSEDPSGLVALEEVIYSRERYAFPFRPPTDFAPKLEEQRWRTPYQGEPYEARWWTIALWASPDGHEAIQAEFERLNAAAAKAGGEHLFANPLGCLRALEPETRYFFARRRLLWRWLRGESLDALPTVIVSHMDVPRWGRSL